MLEKPTTTTTNKPLSSDNNSPSIIIINDDDEATPSPSILLPHHALTETQSIQVSNMIKDIMTSFNYNYQDKSLSIEKTERSSNIQTSSSSCFSGKVIVVSTLLLLLLLELL